MIFSRLALLAVFAAATAIIQPCAAAGLAPSAIASAAADEWTFYGVRRTLGEDAGAPGGVAMTVEAPRNEAAPWSSGAMIHIDAPVKAGEVLTAVIWLRAARDTKVSAVLASTKSPYPLFAGIEAAGAGEWRRVVLSGVVEGDGQAGQYALSLHLGAAGAVTLGPAFILRGTPSETELDSLASAYATEWVAQDLAISAPDGVMLAATLRTPLGQGPFPVVVTIPGSGPQVRGGFVAVNERLLQAGIATLEYDKRGNGQSGGARSEAVPVLAGDAVSALQFLKGRREVDSNRVAVLGSSQGGMVATAAAVQSAGRAPLRGVVLLATPAIGLDQVAADQVATQLHDGWPQGGSYEDQKALADRLIAVVRSSPDLEIRQAKLKAQLEVDVASNRIPAEAIPLLIASFMDPSARDGGLDYQPAPVLEKVTAPVLAVFGSKDFVVSSNQNVPTTRRALRGNPDASIVEIEGLNHVMQVARTGLADEWGTLGRPFNAKAVLDLIVPWLAAKLDVTP